MIDPYSEILNDQFTTPLTDPVSISKLYNIENDNKTDAKTKIKSME